MEICYSRTHVTPKLTALLCLHELFLNGTETKAVVVFLLVQVEEVFPKLTVCFFKMS